MPDSNPPDQLGFSLVEVLVVLVISGAIMVSLTSMILMSMRSVNAINEANTIDSKFFFFDEQFTQFVRSINGEPHPDSSDTCQFTGTSSKINGCFFNLFDSSRSLEVFSLSVNEDPSGSSIEINFLEESTVWIQHEADIVITYYDALGREHSQWPAPNPTNRRSVFSGQEEDEIELPTAIAVIFQRSAPARPERKIFVNL